MTLSKVEHKIHLTSGGKYESNKGEQNPNNLEKLTLLEADSKSNSV